MWDEFDEISTRLLLSDVALALTFIELGRSRPAGESRIMAFHHASHAYHTICKGICCARISEYDLKRLGVRLQELKDALEEEGQRTGRAAAA
jgi:hypothetical protein